MYLLLALVIFWGWELRQRERDRMLSQFLWVLPEQVNSLRTPSGTGPGLEITLNDPVELDGMTKAQVDQLRRDLVGRYPELVQSPYEPAAAVFGPIVDGKPWWGLNGQFCYGPGEMSTAGPSEESRFIANPLALLVLDTFLIYPRQQDCEPAYVRPQRLFWAGDKPQAYLSFDVSRFFQERGAQGLPTWSTDFSFDHLNARDFGYNFLYVDPRRSRGIRSVPQGRVLQQPCLLRGFIHLGQSCGYPGGCNNGSPHQPELYFVFTELPARMVCKLWKQPPRDHRQAADFEFVVEAF